MSLSNSQYNQLMREYDRQQLDNEYQLRERYAHAYAQIPQLKEIDDEISSGSVQKARLLLDGDDTALSSLKEEIRSLTRKKQELLKANGLPENYLELHYHCPDCRDTGYIGTQKCHCFKQKIVDLLYTQSNVREAVKTENFQNFCLDFYSKGHMDPNTKRSSFDSIQAALKSSFDFVEHFTDAPNILFYGDTGVGKTYLSHCIAKELMDRSVSVLYLTATELFEIFADNTFGKRDERDTESYDHIYDCDLLIIDDLGTEFANTFTVSQLFICINERIIRHKSTIISTNLALDDIRTIYSDRIFSRISSNYTLLKLTGDDIRIQKKLLNIGGMKDATTQH